MATKSSRSLERTRIPGIYRRGDRYAYRFRGPDGRMRQGSARTLAEARRLRSDRDRRSVTASGPRLPTRVTFEEHAPKWLETYRGSTSRGVRPETLAEYRADLALAAAYFGRTRLTSIGPSGVRGFAIRLAEEGRGARTVRRIMGTLRLVLASAVEDGLLKANPALGVRLGGIGAKPAHAGQSEEERARVLTPEEIRKLIQATSEGQRRLLVRLVAATGLRISEALGLRWSDLDVAARSGSVAGRVRGGRYGAVKSAQGIRAVPIPANLARDLAAHRLASRWSADADYVFATRNGTARTRERTYGWLHDAVEKAGVPWPGGWHGLRRSCASAWLAAGVPLATVAQLLGHRPDVTLRAYAHGRANDLPTGEALAAAVGAV